MQPVVCSYLLNKIRRVYTVVVLCSVYTYVYLGNEIFNEENGLYDILCISESGVPIISIIFNYDGGHDDSHAQG